MKENGDERCADGRRLDRSFDNFVTRARIYSGMNRIVVNDESNDREINHFWKAVVDAFAFL